MGLKRSRVFLGSDSPMAEMAPKAVPKTRPISTSPSVIRACSLIKERFFHNSSITKAGVVRIDLGTPVKATVTCQMRMPKTKEPRKKEMISCSCPFFRRHPQSITIKPKSHSVPRRIPRNLPCADSAAGSERLRGMMPVGGINILRFATEIMKIT
jgi:hypothetical protein